jgi:hypothetical protein
VRVASLPCPNANHPVPAKFIRRYDVKRPGPSVLTNRRVPGLPRAPGLLGVKTPYTKLT